MRRVTQGGPEVYQEKLERGYGEVLVLYLEENSVDAELVRSELRAGGFDCDWLQARTKSDFISALHTRPVGLILAEYLHTGFDGISALALARRCCPGVPFIFVSASLDEEVAVEAVQSGASDYVSKYRLSKLGPAIRRALDRLSAAPRQQTMAG
jgi:DNA-binding response OmpR family regulator